MEVKPPPIPVASEQDVQDAFAAIRDYAVEVRARGGPAAREIQVICREGDERRRQQAA